MQAHVNSAVLCLLVALMVICVKGIRSGRQCNPDKLTVYRLYLKTAWSRNVFPKQYPEFRPPAQWSKLLGRSHNASYVLFHVDEKASDGLKQFAESGATDVLQKESQGEGGIFDEFNAPPITEGVGEVETEFFVDGNHSLVSLASRIIPSPDWFVGIDSFDLCVEGKWIDSIMLELGPMDAGTDKGFTFTSPNWPTLPKIPISRITAQMPNHPANSFYYPDRLENPPISTVYIVKVKEYELSRVFFPTLPSETSKKDDILPMTLNERPVRGNDVFPIQDEAVGTPTYSQDASKHNLISSLVKNYKRKFKKNRKVKKMRSRRFHKPRDCIVSEWGPWSACSKPCGIGEQERKRKILKHSRRGGRPCPALKENKWCGSSRGCAHKYFDW